MSNGVSLHTDSQGHQLISVKIKRYLRIVSESILILIMVFALYLFFIDMLQKMFPMGTSLSEIISEKVFRGGFLEQEDKDIRLSVDGQELAYSGNTELAAKIIERHKSVKIKRANGISWFNVNSGLGLHARDAVQTFNRSSAVIRLSNAGDISLGENSLIIIRNVDEDILLQEKRARILMIKGVLQGTVAGKTRNNTNTNTNIRITTPSGATAIFSNDQSDKVRYKIKVNKDKSSVITVFEGTARVMAQDKVVTLLPNQVVTIQKDSEPGLPEYLPDIVTLVSPFNSSIFYYRDLPPKINFKWKLQSNVDDYQFVLSRDRHFKDIVSDIKLKNTYFKHGNLRDGRYFWRVRSRENRKESVFSEPREIRVVKDVKPPVMEVDMPPSVLVMKDNKTDYELKGKTEKEASVFVNSIPVVITEQGEFSYSLKLKYGNNVIIIEAIDIAGNITYVSKLINVKR